MNKIDNQKFIISRFDHYFDTVNNKGTFLITFQSFLIGAVLVGNRKLDDLVTNTCWKSIFNVLSVFFTLLALVSIYQLLKAVFPYVKSGHTNNGSYKSLIFFDSIGEIATQVEYHNKMDSISEPELLKDLTYQSYQLAKGLSYKFKKLNTAITFIYWEIFILILMILIIIF